MAGNKNPAVTVRGLKELRWALKEMGLDFEKRVVAAASRKAMRVVLDLAKAKAPRGTGKRKARDGFKLGHMADSLTITAKRKVRKGQVVMAIGSPTHGSLLHLVEFGTKPHIIEVPIKRKGDGIGLGRTGRAVQQTKRLSHPGAPAQPFMRPAIDAGASTAADVFGKEIAKAIARHGKRGARK